MPDGTSDDSTDDTTDTESDDQEPGTATGATVPVEPVQTLAPVPLESVGGFRTGLTVESASISAVEAEAKAPGEISGPALRVTVDAANDAGDAVSLDGVVVFLSYGDERTPASQFAALRPTPWSATWPRAVPAAGRTCSPCHPTSATTCGSRSATPARPRRSPSPGPSMAEQTRPGHVSGPVGAARPGRLWLHPRSRTYQNLWG